MNAPTIEDIRHALRDKNLTVDVDDCQITHRMLTGDGWLSIITQVSDGSHEWVYWPLHGSGLGQVWHSDQLYGCTGSCLRDGLTFVLGPPSDDVLAAACGLWETADVASSVAVESSSELVA